MPNDTTIAVDDAVTIAPPSLTHEPLSRLMMRVALPAVASNLLMTVFLAVDAYWIGTRLGATSLAAVTAAIFWVWMAISVAEMVSIGLTAVAARRHGEGDAAAASRAVTSALVLTIVLGTCVALAGRLFAREMLAVMHAPEPVVAAGAQYLGIYLLATPVLYGYFVVDAAFRASGDTRTPLLILAASVVVSLVLDPVLILGAGRIAPFGIRGAALATVSTRSIAFVVGLAVLARRGMVARTSPRIATMLHVARIGLPTAATGVLFSIVYVVVARTASSFGTATLAALGLGFRIESWLYMIGVGFGAAAAAIVGQNLGAGRVDRAARTGWLMVGYCMLPAAIVVALSLGAPRAAAGVFTSDAAVVAQTASYLRIAWFSQLLVSAEVVLEGALGGAGYTLMPMITSTTLTVARVPLALWSARFGPTGLWWTIATTAAGRGLAMMALWRAGRWKRARV